MRDVLPPPPQGSGAGLLHGSPHHHPFPEWLLPPVGTAPLRRGRRERPGGRSGVPRPGVCVVWPGWVQSLLWSGRATQGKHGAPASRPVPGGRGCRRRPGEFHGQQCGGNGTVLFQDERLRLLSSSQMGSLKRSETMSQILKS